MHEQPQNPELRYREWDRDRPGDNCFRYVVPSVKWDFFTRKLRPLADDHAAEVAKRLFAGIVHPFHYEKARGWMRKIFEKVLLAPDWMERGLSLEAALAEAFGPDPGMTFVVSSYGPVYAASWFDMLDVIRRGWLMQTTLDTWILCAEKSRAVAFRWESTGLYFGKRGHRSLTNG